MPEGLIETAAQATAPADRRIYGVTVAQVINNVDSTGQGRVQVRLPWLPSLQPWARVAVLDAGMARGTYFIPQIGDEVLVAFNHGDVREPYVIGGLWNAQDRPPALLPTDPVNKRIIRTPLGHEIEFDDALQSITISTITQQKITIDPTSIKLSTTGNTASLTLDVAGNVSIQATTSIELKAPSITIQGTSVDIQGAATASIKGGSACEIQGGIVKIN
jgi:phage baseplate assembly protein V